MTGKKFIAHPKCIIIVHQTIAMKNQAKSSVSDYILLCNVEKIFMIQHCTSAHFYFHIDLLGARSVKDPRLLVQPGST